MYLPDNKVYVIVVYRPPNSTYIQNIELLSYLHDFCYGKNVILMEDFNLPSINWCDIVPSATSLMDRLFLDMFLELGLSQ